MVFLRRILAFRLAKITRKLSVESDAMMDSMAQGRVSANDAALYLKVIAAWELDRQICVQTVTKVFDRGAWSQRPPAQGLSQGI